VLPIARAGASLVAVKNICEFQGMIAAITPMGIRVVIACTFGLSIGRTVHSTL
jgi:type IV secretory pathway TrbD component